VDGFLGGDYDEVYRLFEFLGMAKQLPVVSNCCPFRPLKKKKTEDERNQPYLAEHICEPSVDELLGDLLPAMSLCRFTAPCWKHPPVSTLPA
jgi:F-type H+-transporting ATPase subunit gamma